MNNITPVRHDADLVYGSREEISALAKRIKTMCPGGDKLNENEALALAQVATVTKLNPFIGEVWYIPGKGPMIGIKGARRIENEETRKENGYSWLQFEIITAVESGAPQPEKVFRAYRCIINDINATKAYLAVFHDALEMLRSYQPNEILKSPMPSKDPYEEAKEICGPRPSWVGYGYSLIGEPSRMNPDALARKRAEADALKKRIVLPFGIEISATETEAITTTVVGVDPYVEPFPAESPKLSATEEENLEALGFDDKLSPIQKEILNYTKLCARADAVKVTHESLSEHVTIDQARTAYRELLDYVTAAEAQAKAAE